jgi:hypothetical protein
MIEWRKTFLSRQTAEAQAKIITCAIAGNKRKATPEGTH